MSDELRQLRELVRDVAGARGRQSTPSSAGATLLCVTASDGSYPAVAKSVYVATPQQVDADDAEGASSTQTASGNGNIFAVNTGSAVPPQGTVVICSHVGGRWCFRYDG